METEEDDQIPEDALRALALQRGETYGIFCAYARLYGLFTEAVKGNAELASMLKRMHRHALEFGAEHGRTAGNRLTEEEREYVARLELEFCKLAYEQSEAEHAPRH